MTPNAPPRPSDPRDRPAASGWALAIAGATATPYWQPDPGAGLRPAGFWIRVVAATIDVVLLVVTALVVVGPIVAVVAGFAHASSAEHTIDLALGIATLLVLVVCFWLYYALHEASSERGTPGKQLLHLEVQDELGAPLTFWGASLRFWVKYLLAVWTLGIAFAMAAFQRRKQGFHDQICGTVVIRSDRVPEPLALLPVGPNLPYA